MVLATTAAQRYFDDVLRTYVGPFLNGLPGAILLEGNAHSHATRIAQDFPKSYSFFQWPTGSPDLSPICGMLPCHSVDDLKIAVQNVWTHLIRDNIWHLITQGRSVLLHILQQELDNALLQSHSISLIVQIVFV
ncbi:hypothetical protein HNY73_017489 [Argiope bruennichi]|uniref:Uncharacterized protein n=1 Tax=Argiope bruennichi TaxID=94029 RepID=A0A8T0EDT9_ARGBR|nr:hypothetical protein HNY73_017489 [Argiope bruennichi]